MVEFNLTDWAQRFLDEINEAGRAASRYPWQAKTEHDLFNFLVADGAGYSKARVLVWGPLEFPKSWKEYARELRKDGKSLEWIAIHLGLIYYKSNSHSQLVRLFNEEAKEKQKIYDRNYRRRIAAKKKEQSQGKVSND